MNVNKDSDRIKSAYEKAMERAEEMTGDEEASVDYERREAVKPIVSRFFRGEIDSDELWQEFQGKNEEELRAAQQMIIDTLGLNSSEEEIDKRREGLMALEDHKKSPAVSTVERSMDQISKVIDQYNSEQERLREKLKDMLRRQMQQQQQQGQLNGNGGPMQMVQHLDEDTRRRIAQTREQMENKFQQQWEEVRGQLLEALGLE